MVRDPGIPLGITAKGEFLPSVESRLSSLGMTIKSALGRQAPTDSARFGLVCRSEALQSVPGRAAKRYTSLPASRKAPTP